MPFKLTDEVDNVGSVPQEYRPLYGEADENGAAVINEASKPLAAAINNLNGQLAASSSKLKTVNNESAERRAALTAFTALPETLGVTLEDGQEPTQAILGYVESLRKNGEANSDLTSRIETERRAAKDAQAAMTDTHSQVLAKMNSSIGALLIDRDAATALSSEGGSVELLMPVIRDRVKVFSDGEDQNGITKYVSRVVDSNGDAVPDGKGGYTGVADLVSALKADPVYAPAFASAAKPGSGTKESRNASGGNQNLTSAQKIAAGIENLMG